MYFNTLILEFIITWWYSAFIFWERNETGIAAVVRTTKYTIQMH